MLDTEVTALTGQYELYQQHLQQSQAAETELQSVQPQATNSWTYTISNLTAASSYFRVMNYCSGYSNHCTPTATTNVVMYWKYARGLFATNSSNPITVFQWFHTNMGTTDSNGTSWNNMVGPIQTYCNAYSGSAYNSINRDTSVTYNEICSYLDRNIPVMLSILAYDGDENHTVNIWGYNSSGTQNYLYMSNNWGNVGTYSYSLMNYASYSYGQYIYISLSV